MFSLIITVISIASVIALAAATVYYGGNSLNRGTNSATNSKLLSQGQQLTAALSLYQADHGSYPAGTSSDVQAALMSGNYLASMPDTNWVFNNGSVSISPSSLTSSSCLTLNQSLGVNSIPSCSDPAYQSMAICCQ